MQIKKHLFLTTIVAGCLQLAAFAQNISTVGNEFPEWREGFMDIHHINTGRGESVFFIFPDGTTMLIDAGEIASGARVTSARPDDSRPTGEWITRYILHMMRPLHEKKLDYAFLTHFDSDHIGSVSLSKKKSAKGAWMLSGITEVGEHIPIGKLVDRNYPHYDFPKPRTSANMQNYLAFVKHHTATGGAAEQLMVGSGAQFCLLKQPQRYPQFEIRNIAANGVVWTGVHNNVRNHFPPIASIPEGEIPGENQCSGAIRISYGRFDYFNGGDIVHAFAHGTWRDIETPVGLAAGPVDVCEANHHATNDAMGEPFLSAVRPRVIIMQLWSAGHPDNRGLTRMMAKWIYPGERDIFATNVHPAPATVIGDRIDQLKSRQGHIVIRVQPGGGSYYIYVLDDAAETFTVKAVHGPYESN